MTDHPTLDPRAVADAAAAGAEALVAAGVPLAGGEHVVRGAAAAAKGVADALRVHLPAGEVGAERPACGVPVGRLVNVITDRKAPTCPACIHLAAQAAWEDALVHLVAAALSSGAVLAMGRDDGTFRAALEDADPALSLGEVLRPLAAQFVGTRRDLARQVLEAALALDGAVAP
jgi:hypothetical protein